MMERAHYRFIILEQVVGGAIINFIINGAIGLGVNHGATTIPLWGVISIGGDIVVTAFLLTLFTGLIVTFVTRRKIQNGHLPRSIWRRSSHAILGKLPEKILTRSLVLALIFTAIFATAMVFILVSLHIIEMRVWPFALFKASFSAFLAILAGPIFAICAIGDGEELAVRT